MQPLASMDKAKMCWTKTLLPTDFQKAIAKAIVSGSRRKRKVGPGPFVAFCFLREARLYEAHRQWSAKLMHTYINLNIYTCIHV